MENELLMNNDKLINDQMTIELIQFDTVPDS